MAYKRSNFPETYDVFVEKLDLPASKLPLIEEYHTLYTKEVKTDEEKARLNVLMKDLESHLYTPEHINHFQDAMTNVQKFFVENTNVYVQRLQDETTTHMDNVKLDATTHVNTKKAEMDTYTDLKQQEIVSEIDKFKHRGTYNPSIQYFERNVVDFNDGTSTQSYIATKDAIGIEPTVQTYWTKLTIQGSRGQKGLDGVGLKFKGRYNRVKTYAKDEGVQFGGVMFASLVDGNIDNTPSLTVDTAYWAKALDVTVTVQSAVGVRTVATDTDTVNFIIGEITAFNKDVDTLEVYQNSVRLTKGVDYEIGLDNQTIIKKVDIWEGSVEPIFFEFFVIRNQVNDLVFSDGQSIANGTVTKNKLSLDVQTEIDKMPILTEKVKLETPLNTTSQDLSGAVNELEARKVDLTPVNDRIDGLDKKVSEHLADNAYHGRVGAKEVDETNIANGASPYYDESLDKLVYPEPQYIYGVEIDEANSNPKTAVTYTDDAVGFTGASGNNGAFNWGSWESIVKDEFKIRPCVLNNPAKTVNYYLDYDNYNLKAVGGASVLTGADGDVMVEFGIDIYTKWTIVGNKHHIQFSIKPFDGAVKNAFETENGYNQFAYYPLLLTQKLFQMIFKNRDGQTALGRGYVNGNSAYANTGGTNTKGFMFGETTGKQQMKFLGIEDYWGNKYQWIDGLVTDASYNILIGNGSFNDSGSGYTSYSSGVSVNTTGYIDTVQGGNDKGFIIKGKTGSETTHYCDIGSLYSGRVAEFGGSRSEGSIAGFALLLLIHDASFAAAFLGARLMCVNNGKLYIGAYLGTTQSGKLRSVSNTTASDNKTISVFRNEAKANN